MTTPTKKDINAEIKYWKSVLAAGNIPVKEQNQAELRLLDLKSNLQIIKTTAKHG
jgi:hypothetical protein